MELYATTALSGLGYLSSGNPSSSFRTENLGAPVPNDVPTMTNAYQSDGVRAARRDELLRGSAMFDASQSPLQTGIVPRPAYASMFQAPLQKGGGEGGDEGEGIRSLSGEVMRPEQFTHKNMQPFFGGFMRQNVDSTANSSLLETYTGRGGDLQHKKEVKGFFKPERGVTNICGGKESLDFYTSRMQPTVSRNNEFPVEQIRVGPGLNQGFTSLGSGGFQQAETRDYVMPPTVDELRVLTNPKMEFEAGPLGPAGSIVNNRGLQAPVEKHRPELYHEQSPDQWLKTTGAYIAETGRPQEVIKPTARVQYSDSDYIGVGRSTEKVGQGANDDFGKTGVMVYDNERDVTETRTVQNNVTSIIKAIIAPFTDILRHNLREFTVDHPRSFGSMNAQIPEKGTMYDPVNHVTRTTIKETTIHDGVIGNLTKSVPDSYAMIQDEAKTTGRETLDEVETTVNVGYTTYKSYVYDVDDVAKTTIRETMERNNREEGNMGGGTERSKPGAYSVIPITVYATQKQFVSDNAYLGASGSTGDFRGVDEYAAYNMHVDATREAIEITERLPTPSGAAVPLSKDGVNMKTNRAVSESIAPRKIATNPNRTNSQYVLSADSCTETKPSTRLVQCGIDRINPELLSAFKSNPFTQSLNSAPTSSIRIN